MTRTPLKPEELTIVEKALDAFDGVPSDAALIAAVSVAAGVAIAIGSSSAEARDAARVIADGIIQSVNAAIDDPSMRHPEATSHWSN
jgi:hypothetical protein